MAKYVILGAGISGLSSALALIEQGETDILIIEKEDSVGGLCRSFGWEGCTLDFGPHRIHPTVPRAERLIGRILSGDLVKVHRKSEMVLQGRRISYPVKPLEIVRALGFRRSVGLLGSYVARPFSSRVRGLPAGSYASYFAKSFGWGLYELIFDGYGRKVWHEDPAHVGEDVARIRVATGGMLDTIKETFRRDSKHTVSEFLYPRGGIGVLPRKMAEEVRRAGCEILTDARPKRIVINDSGVRELVLDVGGEEKTIRAERLISTVPLTDLLRTLPSSKHIHIDGLEKQLPYSDLRLACFLFDKGRVTGNSWMYFPDPDLMITRLYEPDNFERSCVPEGKSCIVVEVHCRKHLDVWSEDDHSFLERVTSDLRRVGLMDEGKLVSRGTMRVENAYPLHLLGYRRDLDKLIEAIREIPGLISTGRCGLHCYNNLDHSIEMGLTAGEFAAKPISQSHTFYDQAESFNDFRIID